MSAQRIVFDAGRAARTVMVERQDDGGAFVVLTAEEGEQATGRDEKGSLCINVGLVLSAEQLEALIALLEGRQIAPKVNL